MLERCEGCIFWNGSSKEKAYQVHEAKCRISAKITEHDDRCSRTELEILKYLEGKNMRFVKTNLNEYSDNFHQTDTLRCPYCKHKQKLLVSVKKPLNSVGATRCMECEEMFAVIHDNDCSPLVRIIASTYKPVGNSYWVPDHTEKNPKSFWPRFKKGS